MADPDRRSTLLVSFENAEAIVSGIDAEQLRHPTPCRNYDVAGLVDHVVEAAHRAAALGRGQAPPPGDRSPHVELSDAPASYAAPLRRRRRHGATIPGCRRGSPCPGVSSTPGPP
jgi:hypothetical protein